MNFKLDPNDGCATWNVARVKSEVGTLEPIAVILRCYVRARVVPVVSLSVVVINPFGFAVAVDTRTRPWVLPISR